MDFLNDNSEKRKAVILTNDQLASYIAEFNEDVKLSLHSLREKSLMCSSIWAKWLQYLYKEKENLQNNIDSMSEKIKHHFLQNIQKDILLILNWLILLVHIVVQKHVLFR